MSGEPGRVLGVDPGDARIGLAVSDPTGLIARPLETVRVRGVEEALRAIEAAAREWEVEAVVVGLPLHMFGEEGERARAARALAARIGERLALPVHLVDERLTTAEAVRHLRDSGLSRKAKKERRDAVAAQLILQTWLDRRRAPEPDPEPPTDPAVP